MKILRTIMEYFMHASTWKGVIAIATAAGLALTEAQQGAIIAAGLALIGVVQVFIDDQDKAPKL